MTFQGTSNSDSEEKFAWTVPNVNWSSFHLDTSLDAYLHRAFIHHGELKNMSQDFFDAVSSCQIEVSVMTSLFVTEQPLNRSGTGVFVGN